MPSSPDQAGAQATGELPAPLSDDPAADLLLALDALDGSSAPPARRLLLSTLGHLRDAVVLRGHRREVLSASLDKSGQLAVTGSLDHRVAVWDATDGEQRAIFDLGVPPRFRPHGPQFDSTGDRIVVNGVDGLVRIIPWREDGLPPPLPVSVQAKVSRTAMAAGKLLLGHTDGRVQVVSLDQPAEPIVLIKDPTAVPIASVAISDDGRSAAAADREGRVWLFDLVRLGRPLVLSRHDGDVNQLAFRPDGKQLASASDDTTVNLYAVLDGHLETTLRTHGERVNAVAYDAGGARILSASVDKSVIVHDSSTGHPLAVMEPALDEVQQVAIDPSGRLVAMASADGTCSVHHASNGRTLWKLQHGGPVSSVQFGPDGTLITASFDHTARVWNVGLGKVLWHPKEANTVACSHDGTKLVTTCEDGRTRVIDLDSGRLLAVEAEQEGAANGAELSPDGASLAIAGQDGIAWVVPWEGGGESTKLIEEFEVEAVAFDGSGDYLVTGTRRRAAVWRWKDEERVATMGPSAEERAVNPLVAIISVDISEDRSLVASGHYSQEMRLYDGATGQELGRLATRGIVYTVAFGPGKTLIASSGDGTARVVDAERLEERHVLVGPSAQLRSAALSPSGERAVVGGADGLVTVFDVDSERVLWVGKRHLDAVMSVAFCREGRVVSAGDDGTVQLLDLDNTPSMDERMVAIRAWARPAPAGQ